jgi:hypothetical protein
MNGAMTIGMHIIELSDLEFVTGGGATGTWTTGATGSWGAITKSAAIGLAAGARVGAAPWGAAPGTPIEQAAAAGVSSAGGGLAGALIPRK